MQLENINKQKSIHEQNILHRFISTEDDIIVDYYESNENAFELSLCGNNDYAVIICLHGMAEIIGDENKTIFSIHENEHNLLSQSTYPFTIKLNAHSILCRIIFTQSFISQSIHLNDALYQHFLSIKSDRIFTLLNCNKLLQSNTLHAIQKMLQYSPQDFYQQQFVSIKAKEIFCLQRQQFQQNECALSNGLKAYQVEKIQKVKEIIKTKINTPCSLLQLAKEVGINDCTLKKGFKEIYGTTIFAYLTDLKMNKAVELLKQKDLNINEISEKVGYRDASNFIAAFKRKFNCSPKKYII